MAARKQRYPISTAHGEPNGNSQENVYYARLLSRDPLVLFSNPTHSAVALWGPIPPGSLDSSFVGSVEVKRETQLFWHTREH